MDLLKLVRPLVLVRVGCNGAFSFFAGLSLSVEPSLRDGGLELTELRAFSHRTEAGHKRAQQASESESSAFENLAQLSISGSFVSRVLNHKVTSPRCITPQNIYETLRLFPAVSNRRQLSHSS